jgi:hypothetical protein
MNISGVTQTMPTMEQQFPMIGATQPTQQAQEIQPSSPSVSNVGMEASTQALDIANRSFEEAANQILRDMATMTGVGQNLDIRV